MFEFPAQGARPVWIASYPRSGNTFLRIILQNCFHLPSFSIYRVEGDSHPDPSADALEDAPVLPLNWRECLKDSGDLPPVMIKTHDPPADSAPAIFIARDGRAALHSYYHYHKKFAFEQPTLTELIAGACQFGSWSQHYWAWHPRNRPRTLLLQYDELVAHPEAVIPRLAAFLNLPATAAGLPGFQELQKRSPAFFRRGKNSDFLTEWSPVHMALFNQLHATAMQDLGLPIVPAEASAAEAAAELAHSAARLHQLYLEQLSNAGRALLNYQKETHELSAQVRALSDWIEQVHKPLARAPWVRFGMALGALPAPARPPLNAGPAHQPNGKPEGGVKSSGESTRSSLPVPGPAAPAVPSADTSARA